MKYLLIWVWIIMLIGCGKDAQVPIGQDNGYKITTLDPQTFLGYPTVYLGGHITAPLSNSAKIISRGVCWDLNPGPTIADSNAVITVVTGGLDSFRLVSSGFLPNKTYYTRSFYEIFPNTPIYGNEIIFTTPIFLPGVNIVSLIPGKTNAAISCSVTSTGGGTIFNRWLDYSVGSGSVRVSLSNGPNPFSVNITGLTANTQYQVTVHATNEAGDSPINSSNNMTFKTTK